MPKEMSIFANLTNISIMSEKELNAYRFSPEQGISNQKATEEHWKQMQQDIATKQAKWKEKINALVYDRK